MKRIEGTIPEIRTNETEANHFSFARKVGSGVLIAILTTGGIVTIEKTLDAVSSHNPDFDIDGILGDTPAK